MTEQDLENALNTIDPVIRHDVMLKMCLEINRASQACYLLARCAGWWKDRDPRDPYVFGTLIALIHSEVSEALEGGRKNKMDDHLPHRKAEEVELADTLIRIFDLAGARQLDLGGAMVEKMAYNMTRADHHPENRGRDGGKKF